MIVAKALSSCPVSNTALLLSPFIAGKRGVGNLVEAALLNTAYVLQFLLCRSKNLGTVANTCVQNRTVGFYLGGGERKQSKYSRISVIHYINGICLRNLKQIIK